MENPLHFRLDTPQLLKEAKKRGFVSGRYFCSATGVPDCLVSGALIVKNSTDPEEKQFNGDLVSTGGYGIIYDASTDSWGVLTNEILVGSGITGVNARRVSDKILK